MTDLFLDPDPDPRDAGEPHSLFDHSGVPDYGAESYAAREALARLAEFNIRAAGGVAFTSGQGFQDFCHDLIEQARVMERKRPRTKEPEVWSAAEQLSAVKYAREQGFVTPLEGQKIVRKLLKLRGMRSLAVPAPRARRATGTRRTTR